MLFGGCRLQYVWLIAFAESQCRIIFAIRQEHLHDSSWLCFALIGCAQTRRTYRQFPGIQFHILETGNNTYKMSANCDCNGHRAAVHSGPAETPRRWAHRGCVSQAYSTSSIMGTEGHCIIYKAAGTEQQSLLRALCCHYLTVVY